MRDLCSNSGRDYLRQLLIQRRCGWDHQRATKHLFFESVAGISISREVPDSISAVFDLLDEVQEELLDSIAGEQEELPYFLSTAQENLAPDSVDGIQLIASSSKFSGGYI